MPESNEDKKPKPIVLPRWFEGYRDLITNTGGNKVEDLLYRLRHEKNLFHSNHIVYVMAADVEGQVGMLHRLFNAGLLKDIRPHVIKQLQIIEKGYRDDVYQKTRTARKAILERRRRKNQEETQSRDERR